MPDDEQVGGAVDTFRMLADPTRVKILWALMQGETSVAWLADLVHVTPTTVSQHLSKLRLAGVVKGRRQGTYVYYTVTDDHVRDVLAVVLREPDRDEGIGTIEGSATLPLADPTVATGGAAKKGAWNRAADRDHDKPHQFSTAPLTVADRHWNQQPAARAAHTRGH